jgi:sodium/bile acid cotransporter 7
VVQTICIVGIFIISGLTLKSSEVKAALQAWLAFGYGVLAILFLTPLAGILLVLIPFDSPSFAIGFAVFCCVPTTLTSGVTLATQAGGNTALALMLTVTTNIVGVFTTPLMLALVLTAGGVSADTGSIRFDTAQLILKLFLTILVPTLVGKVVRESHRSVAPWVTAHKLPLSLTNNGLLIAIVWMTISTGSDTILSQQPTTLLLVVAVGIALHIFFLLFNGVAVWALRMRAPQRKAVHILSSQKTLPVAITVISFLPPRLGTAALITIPCIIGHLSQLFMDAFLVSNGRFERPGMWCGRHASNEAEEEKASSVLGDATSPRSGEDSSTAATAGGESASVREDISSGQAYVSSPGAEGHNNAV